MRRRAVIAVAVSAASIIGCGGGDDAGDPAPAPSSTETATEATSAPTTDEAARADQLYPDVVGAEATEDPDGTWTFAVTISSPYDTPDRYADAWRVVGPDGTVLGERILLHDHAGEQPFTRSLDGVEIPAAIDSVTIEGRDLRNGYGGDTLTVELDRTAA